MEETTSEQIFATVFPKLPMNVRSIIMKKVIKASTTDPRTGSENEPIFRAVDIVAILSQITPLKKYNIALVPNRLGSLQLIVGDEQYQLTE